jgi:hypothetical protein
MSDMIDSLHKAAIEAGTASARDLAAPATVAVLQGRVRSGVRKRRLRAAAAGIGAMAMIGVGAVGIPALLADAPVIQPGEDSVTVVSTVGNLTVFSDGSMSVVTQRGGFVNLPAPEPADAQPFVALSGDQACAFDPDAAELGWSFASEEARQLLLFAQPQALDDGYTRRTTASGEMVPRDQYDDYVPLAITLNTEPGVAEHLGVRQMVYTLYREPSGAIAPIVLHHAGAMDAAPKVSIDGDTSAGTAMGKVEARKTSYTGYCGDKYPVGMPPAGSGPYVTQRYLVADIFLIDRSGNSLLLGTHTSWTTTEVTA